MTELMPIDEKIVREETLRYFRRDELATNIWMTKYALQDSSGNYYEKTPDDMHRRLAREFARIEKKYPDPMSEQQIYELLKDFKYIIPQGSPMTAIGNPFHIMSLSNCYVVDSPYDSYGGILHADQELAHIYRRRGGCGIDISTIRPKDLPTANAAKTTDGIGVFMERYSNTTREVAQSGRRGALMMSISVHHPEIMTFINIKKDKTKVTGANISIRLTDEFMNAVVSDSEYEQRFPVDSPLPSIRQMVPARDVWDAIVDSAWESAEPGLLFWDRILEGPADAYPEFRSISTNPCCFAYDSGVKVKTAKDGWKKIEEVVDGDEVWTGIGETYAKASGYFLCGEAEVFEVSVANGQKLIITKDHKLLVSYFSYGQCNMLPVSEILSMREAGIEVFAILDNGEKSLIENICSVGQKQIGCIEVEKYHSFSTNGVISGNSEIPLCAYDSCRLLVLNLMGYVKNPFTEYASFDYELFETHAFYAQRLMDDIVDLEIECIDRILAKIDSDPEPDYIKKVEKDLWTKIKEKCERGRRTGLGLTALGDCLAALGFTYGSESSIRMVDSIYSELAFASYNSSIAMAKERGAFLAFDLEIEKSCPFIRKVVETCDPQTVSEYETYGRRNIANLTTAPCGSISCLAWVGDGVQPGTTSGVESAYLLEMVRRRKVKNEDPHDFVDPLGDCWKEFVVYHPGVQLWKNVTGETDISKSPYWGATSVDVDWNKSVTLQATAQKWICHAISKTCNLPNEATKELVGQVYLEAWKQGCKGFTVYRDGSRMGVLVSLDKKDKDESEFIQRSAPKRPEVLSCDIHQATIKGEKFSIFVGLLDGKPYEVMGGLSSNVQIPSKFDKGELRKTSFKSRPARYDLLYGEDGEVKDVIKMFDNPDYATHTRLISLSLRHGAKVSFVVEQLLKDPDPSLASFSRVISRVLKKYIADGEKVASAKMEGCDTPDQCQLVYEEGCVSCKQCGASKCG